MKTHSTFAVIEPPYRTLEEFQLGLPVTVRYIGNNRKAATQVVEDSKSLCDFLEFQMLSNGFVNVFASRGVSEKRAPVQRTKPDAIYWQAEPVDDLLKRFRAQA